MPKRKILALCLALLCLLCACSKKDAAETQETNAEKVTLVTRDDYINAICGYFECGDSYYSIKTDYLEQIDKTSGAYFNSEYLSDIVISLQNDGASVEIVFYRDNSPRIYLLCSSEGELTDIEGNRFKKITQKDYEAVKALQEESAETENFDDWDSDGAGYDDFYEDPNAEVFTWYGVAFPLNALLYDVQTIDNLLAVGKMNEANAAIKEKIFDPLERGVNELIQSREYWAAHNLIAMYEAVIMDEDFNRNFNFIEDYFEDEYTAEGAIVSMAGPRFSDHVQKYYKQLLVARKADGGRMEQQNCLYKMNEFFLANGGQAIGGLYQDYYKNMYFTEILNYNNDPTDYYIVCPYTGQIRYLPESYYFFDDGHLYEFALKDYM